MGDRHRETDRSPGDQKRRNSGKRKLPNDMLHTRVLKLVAHRQPITAHARYHGAHLIERSQSRDMTGVARTASGTRSARATVVMPDSERVGLDGLAARRDRNAQSAAR